jgi:MarR family transcriptional repressor of emrRAB
VDSRGTNLVATLGTTLGDLIATAVGAATGLSGAAPAALTVLRARPGLSVDALARTVGVTGSGGVRLVDRLVAAGLVERRPGPDARTVSVRLTVTGDDAAHEVLIARQGVVRSLVKPLDREEQATLIRLAEKVLTAATTSPDEAERLCRLCDTDTCPRRRCPVRQPR